MNENVRDDRIQEAFLLFEAGAYKESLALCRGRKDIASEILTAENLLALGQLADAEAAFRDLIVTIPDSVKIHFGLAEALRLRGDPGAAAAYAEAIRLDPTHSEALRQYERCLVEKQDFRAAIPIQKARIRIKHDSKDILSLMHSLNAIGEFEEAIALYRRSFPRDMHSVEYVQALKGSRRYAEAAEAAEHAWNKTQNPAFLHLWLASRARIDPEHALQLYRQHILERPDTELLFSAALLAKKRGYPDLAMNCIQQLKRSDDDPIYHMVFCDLLVTLKETRRADGEYRTIIDQELKTLDRPESLQIIIEKYITFLCSTKTQRAVTDTITALLDPHPSWICLVLLGEMFERFSDHTRARDAYYRAYRIDFIRGGIRYAAYLMRRGEIREAELVMLYILSHATKADDLEMVGKEIVYGDEKLYESRKITGEIERRLMDVFPLLSADGREVLSVASLYAASAALDDGNYQGCKEHCIIGLDVMPCYPSRISISDFLPLITQAKEHALTEQPFIAPRSSTQQEKEVPITERLQLSEKERKAVAFIREHTETHEMEIRSHLGTRRVPGLINEIIRKAGEAGIPIIEKRGISKNGEIYAWIGE